MVIIEIKNSLLSFSSFIAFEFDFQRRHPSMSLPKSIRSHPSIHSSNADCCVAVRQSSSMMDHGLKACLSVCLYSSMSYWFCAFQFGWQRQYQLSSTFQISCNSNYSHQSKSHLQNHKSLLLTFSKPKSPPPEHRRSQFRSNFVFPQKDG